MGYKAQKQSQKKEGLHMAIKVKRNRVNFNKKTVSIGIDMHKLSWRITALVEGDIILAVTLSRPNYAAFRKILSQFKGGLVRVVYEAGPGGFDLYDRLTVDGIECLVTPPSLIPTQSGSKVKTDKKDSLKLARLLESNMLKKYGYFLLRKELTGNWSERVGRSSITARM